VAALRATEAVEDFSYASLVNRWRRERATTTLTKMDGRFYEAFDAHLRSLHDEYQREQTGNPATPKVLILLDELTNLQRVRDDLYDLRERKIVTAALIAAREGRPDRANMTREEEGLFESTFRALQDARVALLRKAQVAAAAKPTGGPVAPLDPAPPLVAPAANLASTIAPSPPTAPEAPLVGVAASPPPAAVVVATAEDASTEARAKVGPARVLVRMKAAVEPFVAPDLRHYRLGAEDVAALPRDVAHVLVQRGLAQALGG
jgi:DNA replication initiation complex subunit (GINS family)